MPRRPEPLLEARDVAVRFPHALRDAVRHVSFSLEPGETLAVLGPSGSGKSSLALALVGAIPHLLPGTRTGRIARNGEAVGLVAGTGRAAAVLQDASAQLVALTVEDELAFGLENRGLGPDEIERRIEQALAAAPAAGLARRDSTLALSGGWRQRLALAAALAEAPEVLVADEPIAHLDEGAARNAVRALAVATHGRHASILVEHRADHIAPLADQVLILGEDGSPVLTGDPTAALHDAAGRPGSLGLRLPATVRVAAGLATAGLLAATPAGAGIDDLLTVLDSRDGRVLPVALASLDLADVAVGAHLSPVPLVRIDNAGVVRGRRQVLHDVHLTIGSGEVVGVVGANGAGKTTLGLLAAGALASRGGRVRQMGPHMPVYVPQNPALSFATGSVSAEAARRGLAWSQARMSLERFGLPADPGRHPLAFSHGEMRRLAIALTVAAPEPRLVVLDEPTAGLDGRGLANLGAIVADMRRDGFGLLVIAHDLDWLASVAERIVVVDAGRIVADAPAAAVLRRILDGDLGVRPSPGIALAARLGWRPGSGAPC